MSHTSKNPSIHVVLERPEQRLERCAVAVHEAQQEGLVGLVRHLQHAYRVKGRKVPSTWRLAGGELVSS
jgi:hypothetical protein